ncbi:20388_t:CDS:2 [Dentiscutata erythropus]|uniref:20388_t:CDS:1 n=1 Tax=Dentiscutata erythropus TaxID=1348616 RepID=A0A9N9HRF0_9GLOM|nr:20388_t:CDS:2 [Dentiscutata erythropus]
MAQAETKVVYPILEKELIEFVKKRREEKGTVITSIIIKKAKSLSETIDIRASEACSNTSSLESPEDISTPMWFDMPRDLTIDFKDAHHSHNYYDVTRALKAEGLDVLEIPRGTTSVLQPPDVSVNKPFKNEMRNLYLIQMVEDDMISDHLKAIVENHLNELPIEDTQAEESNHNDSEPDDDNEQNDNNLDYYDLDYYNENMMDIDYYGEIYCNETIEID